MSLSSGFITKMAPGLSGRFPGLPIVAATAFGFVGFLTFLGYIYDKYYKIEYKDKQNGKTSQGKSTPKETQRDSTIETPQGELTTSQIEHLINVIGTVDNETLENLLISLSNSCAFTQNQNIIREKGGIQKLSQLLHHEKDAVRLRVVQTLSNLAMNIENQKHISTYIPVIQEAINPSQISQRTENEMIAVLQLLVNLSVVDTWHVDMRKCIAYCFDILHMEFLSVKVKVNALRLLVNFSCNKENVEHFLTEKILILAKFMDPEIDEDIILRTVVIELNVLLNIDDSLKPKAKYLADGVQEKLDVLETFRNEEIAAKATRIKMFLNKL